MFLGTVRHGDYWRQRKYKFGFFMRKRWNVRTTCQKKDFKTLKRNYTVGENYRRQNYMVSRKLVTLVAVVLVLTTLIGALFIFWNRNGSSYNTPRNQGNPPSSNADSDNDGLPDEQEKQIGTSPLVADTDNDGLNDGLEVKTYGTKPLVADTDNDTLKDGLEVNGWSILVDGIQIHVTSNPLYSDSDGDGLSDYREYATYLTNPMSSDTDNDKLPDKWETDYSFSPADSRDAYKDPDYDGLTNLQEYLLGTITKSGILSYQKDLFVEIDYMSGYEPSTTVISYFISYYHELNIDVHVTVDDEISWGQLTSIGVSPDFFTPYECNLVEDKFHDNSRTHVYVFYAKALRDSDGNEPLGWASGFGAFINKEKVNSQEGLNVLWLTDRIRVEKVVLLHEIGHTLNVITRNSEDKEDYCSNLGCIMSGADEWWDILGGISQVVVLWSNSPRYCQTHVAMIDLRNKWSVNEEWIP